jgi:hypothetical protein
MLDLPTLMPLDWTALLAAGDFPAARAACDPGASWELAEIEERWGDALFFAGEPGAAAHFRAAQTALVPPGAQFSSGDESERRMEVYGRITNKLYAIDPYGKPRPGHDGRPHPRSSPAAPAPQPEEPSRSERLAAVRESQAARATEQTELAKLFQDADHWRDCELGDEWRQAGQALAGYPDGARRAYAWSLHFLERYNRSWTAHLPASRWDPDGGEEMLEVHALAQALETNAPEARLPIWVEAMLEGDWQRALSSFGDIPPPAEFKPMLVLLAEACRAAGREDAARRLDVLGQTPNCRK